MQKMSDFSIETDDTVLVSFQDGSQQRLAVKQLARLLRPMDASRIRRALKLRRNFLRQHMPRMIVGGVVAGALLLGLSLPDNAPMSQLVHPDTPKPHHPHQAKPAAYLPTPTPPDTAQVEAAGTARQVTVDASAATSTAVAAPAVAAASPAVSQATATVQVPAIIPAVLGASARLLQP
jgi:hypothetical protein